MFGDKNKNIRKAVWIWCLDLTERIEKHLKFLPWLLFGTNLEKP